MPGYHYNWLQRQLQEQQSQNSNILQDMMDEGSLTRLTLPKAQLLELQQKLP